MERVVSISGERDVHHTRQSVKFQPEQRENSLRISASEGRDPGSVSGIAMLTQQVLKGAFVIGGVLGVTWVLGRLFGNVQASDQPKMSSQLRHGDDAPLAAVEQIQVLRTVAETQRERRDVTDPVFPAVFDLTSLDGNNGFRIDGVIEGGFVGGSVSEAGDVNGDGYGDVIIGARGADLNGETDVGISYVIYGRGRQGLASMSLGDLGDAKGFYIAGPGPFDRSGNSVSGAGDFDGDGKDDFIVGMYYADTGTKRDNPDVGYTFVLYGSKDTISRKVSRDINTGDGFWIEGENKFDESGKSVSGAGDINGDGHPDIIIGAPKTSPGGRAYVVYGKKGRSLHKVLLRDIDGQNGFRLDGESENDRLGGSVSVAGDINGDYVDDLIIGASLADPGEQDAAGISYVIYGNRNGFSENVLLSNLDGSNGFRIEGDKAGDDAGVSVSGAGDINGDGIDDLVIGARFADPGGRDKAGSIYVVYGKRSGVSARISLGELNGTNGFRLDGELSGGVGYSVSGAGDINGDGIDDLIVGGVSAKDEMGVCYIVYGKRGGFPENLLLENLDGRDGFRMYGNVTGDRLGVSVSTAGDVDNDGIDDLIVGAIFATPGERNKAGASYVIYGRRQPIAPTGIVVNQTPSPLSAPSGASVATLATIDQNPTDSHRYGLVSGAGDGDNAKFSIDGSVLKIGDNGIDFRMQADYQIRVRSTDLDGLSIEKELRISLERNPVFPAVVNLSDLDGRNGFTLKGVMAGDRFGYAVSGAGDINGDGLSDIVVGAPFANPFGSKDEAGTVYVVFGSRDGFASSVQVSNLVNDKKGFQIEGNNAGDRLGWSVSSTGDVDGNDVADIILGAPGVIKGATHRVGEAYVIFGRDKTKGETFELPISLSNLDGENGFLIPNTGQNSDELGASVSKTGDINGDGIEDVIISAPLAHASGQNAAGVSYVIFGRNNKIQTFESPLNLSELDGVNGFRLDGAEGGDRSGRSVSGAGDVDGDGLGDLIIGAPNTDPGGRAFAGTSYVIYGSNETRSVTVSLKDLGTNGFYLDGVIRSDGLGGSVSGLGDVNGDGIGDIIIGAHNASPLGKRFAGISYVIYGRDNSQIPDLVLSDLDGVNGFQIEGDSENAQSGYAVSAAGDLNDDGFDDVIIGADSVNIAAGEVYVVFGHNHGFLASLNVANFDGINGFRLRGISSFDRASIVSDLDDVNGDGIDDVIIGARDASPGNREKAGEAYIIFGRRQPIAPTSIMLSSPEVAENSPEGTVVTGLTAVDQNPSDAHTFKLVSGEGDTDNGRFEIVGTELRTREIFNYEDKRDYSIRMQVVDKDGLSVEKQLFIRIQDANDAPILTTTLPNAIAYSGDEFSYKVSESLAMDEDDDVLSYTVIQTNGAALPSWLHFDEQMLRLFGTPGVQDEDVGVRFTISDGETPIFSDMQLGVRMREVFGTDDDDHIHNIPGASRLLQSGTGEDVYVIAENPGRTDVLEDMNSGKDRIDLAEFRSLTTKDTLGSRMITISNLKYKGVQLALGAGQQLLIQDVGIHELESDNFIFPLHQVGDNLSLSLSAESTFSKTFAKTSLTSGGRSPITYQIEAQDRPNWLSLTQNEELLVLTGTAPANEAKITVTITVGDGIGNEVLIPLELSVDKSDGDITIVNENTNINDNSGNDGESDSGKAKDAVIGGSIAAGFAGLGVMGVTVWKFWFKKKFKVSPENGSETGSQSGSNESSIGSGSAVTRDPVVGTDLLEMQPVFLAQRSDGYPRRPRQLPSLKYTPRTARRLRRQGSSQVVLVQPAN